MNDKKQAVSLHRDCVLVSRCPSNLCLILKLDLSESYSHASLYSLSALPLQSRYLGLSSKSCIFRCQLYCTQQLDIFCYILDRRKEISGSVQILSFPCYLLHRSSFFAKFPNFSLKLIFPAGRLPVATRALK